MSRLQIYNPRERLMVQLADLALAPVGWTRSRGAAAGAPVRRVLLLRLERIGDLLMALGAIRDARAAWPHAEIDLAVGSWNVPLAKLIPQISSIVTIDAPWLTRETTGGDSWSAMRTRARGWRDRHYDLVINFEPDIRSNLLAWWSGASRRVGYWTGGGGALLTTALEYDPREHVSTNARRLVAAAAGAAAGEPGTNSSHRSALVPPPDAVAAARAMLAGAERPLIGLHSSGGRESKQWHLDRFAAVGRALAESVGGTVVLTGATGDRALVEAVKRGLGSVRLIDAAGALELPALAALLAELDVLVTGDTGPMHLAAAMDTPVVALFGPSQPWRYGPLASHQRILRVDLPCSPCGQVRLPPERCRGHVPDCMDAIQVNAVVQAARELLAEARETPA